MPSISCLHPRLPSIRCSLSTCGCRVTTFVWVSKKLGLIYAETPKCACSSIKDCFEIKSTPEHHARAYLRLSMAGNKPDITDQTFGAKVDVSASEFVEIVRAEAAHIQNNQLLVGQPGALGFQMFDGSLNTCMATFSDFKAFMITRAPLARFMSGWNMFYGSTEFRLRQRAAVTDPRDEAADPRIFLENQTSHPNHHVNSLGHFVPDASRLDQLILVDIRALRGFWSELQQECSPQIPDLAHKNQATKRIYTDEMAHQISLEATFASTYSYDLELYKSGRVRQEA